MNVYIDIEKKKEKENKKNTIEIKTVRGLTGRQAYRIGTATGLDDEKEDQEHVLQIEDLKASVGATPPRATRVQWWCLRCAARRPPS